MINLLPPEYKKRGLFDLPKQWILLGGLTIVAVILLVLFSYTNLIVNEKIAKEKLTIAENKLSNLKAELKTINSLKEKKEKVEQQLADKKEILGTKLELTPILSSMQEVIADDSWLVSFNSTGDGRFEFVGYALDNQGVGNLFNSLKVAPKFKDVTINLVRQRNLDNKGYSQDKIIYYQITGKLVNEGGANNAQLE